MGESLLLIDLALSLGLLPWYPPTAMLPAILGHGCQICETLKQLLRLSTGKTAAPLTTCWFSTKSSLLVNALYPSNLSPLVLLGLPTPHSVLSDLFNLHNSSNGSGHPYLFHIYRISDPPIHCCSSTLATYAASNPKRTLVQSLEPNRYSRKSCLRYIRGHRSYVWMEGINTLSVSSGRIAPDGSTKSFRKALSVDM